MSDKLLQNQKEWSGKSNPRQDFIKYAAELGLDIDKFTEDLNPDKYATIIETDAHDADDLSEEKVI